MVEVEHLQHCFSSKLHSYYVANQIKHIPMSKRHNNNNRYPQIHCEHLIAGLWVEFPLMPFSDRNEIDRQVKNGKTERSQHQSNVLCP